MSKDIVLGNEFSVGGNIGIDEVVSVFVSQYETNLFERKSELSSTIKSLKGELESFEKGVEGSVGVEKYKQSFPILNITSEVEKDGVSVSWRDKVINITVTLTDNDSKRSYGGTFTKRIEKKINKSDLNKHSKLESDIEEVNGELVEVMGLIKTVSRKERLVRGKISEMKLKESGYSNLLENEDMLKLVQLD